VAWERVGDATDVFGPLDSDLRVRVLLALFDRASDPGPDVPAVSYTELKDAVGIEDSGKFNYHLSKLTGQYVRKTDGGYEITEAGRTAVRLVRSEDLRSRVQSGRVELDATCYRCDSAVAVRYHEGRLLTQCTGCQGQFDYDRIPDGTLVGLPVPPSAVRNRDLKRLHAAAHRRFLERIRVMFEDVCPECAGAVERSLSVCRTHEVDDRGICRHCGRATAEYGHLVCRTCGRRRLAHPLVPHLSEPAVADALAAADADGAWDRIATAAAWDRRPAAVDGEDAVVIHPETTSVAFVVAGDLSLTVREASGLAFEAPAPDETPPDRSAGG